jgi:hypothetical protein
MQREDGHRRVDAWVAQRQVVRRGANGREAVGPALRGHHVTGFDGDDVAVVGLVGTGARANVHDAARVAERFIDPLGDPWVLAARRRMALANHLVAIAHAGLRGGRVAWSLTARDQARRRCSRVHAARGRTSLPGEVDADAEPAPWPGGAASSC